LRGGVESSKAKNRQIVIKCGGLEINVNFINPKKNWLITLLVHKTRNYIHLSCSYPGVGKVWTNPARQGFLSGPWSSFCTQRSQVWRDNIITATTIKSSSFINIWAGRFRLFHRFANFLFFFDYNTDFAIFDYLRDWFFEDLSVTLADTPKL